jgi:hypothetical protein
MPSVSKKQQKFMGIVRSIQKGEQPASKFSKDAQDAAKKMKKSSVKKYAKTKHDDLPTKKESTSAYKKSLEKIAKDRQLKMLSKKDKETLLKIAKMMKENNMPDFNPIIDEVLDEVFGEYQMNESSKVLKSIENLAKQNKYGNVTGTKMNGKTANLIMKIYNHPKMKKYQKAMEKYTSDELVDMTLKMPKVLGIKENVDEAAMELNKIKDAILMFQKKIKKQGRVTNARDEDHLKNLIKVYKQMGGKGVKESVNEVNMAHVYSKDLNKKKFKDLGLYLAHVLDLAPNKDFRLTSNKKLLAINIDKINPKSLQNIKKRFGIDLKQKAKEPIRLKSKSGMGKISHLGMESVNEAKKMRFDKDGNRIIPKRTWLRMPDYAKMKKNGKDYVLSIDPKNKKRSVYLPAVIESVNEGQKKQASMILRKFDMAFIKFSREIRDVIKLVDRSTGSKVDGKIIEKAYEKGLIPLNKIMIEWDRGQQENPGLSEDETLEGLGDKFGKKLDKYNKKNKKSKDALKKYAKLKKK